VKAERDTLFPWRKAFRNKEELEGGKKISDIDSLEDIITKIRFTSANLG
jgi:hypothetical protein